MTATTLDATPRMARLTSALHASLKILGDAVDTYAEYRMKKAVTQWELRRVGRDINRYGRMMHASNLTTLHRCSG
jgi:hypothetical protein